MLSRRLLRTKVVKSLYAYLQADGIAIPTAEKNLLAMIDKSYELYMQLLVLPSALAHYAEERQEIARNKKIPTHEELNPNRKFVENEAIARIEATEAVTDFVRKRSLGWASQPSLIKNLYATISEQEYFKQYMASSERSLKEDTQLLNNIYMCSLEEYEPLEEALEEQSALWNDDLGYVLTMAARTVSSIKASHEQIKLLPKFKSDDDLLFAKKLFTTTAIHFEEYSKLIDKYTANWDVERIALMDTIIMVTALCEAITFPSIPTKVTLNEYIDISKYYSTAGSSTFINGVLDKMIVALTAEGRINKIGTGLL